MAVIRRSKKNDVPRVARSVALARSDAKSAGLRLMPFDINGLLVYYGIALSLEDMGDLSGYVENRGGKWIVGVNLYHSRRRQRFTMAHELAHISLHSGDIEDRWEETIYFRTKLTSGQEREANEFASDLLVPEDLLRAQIAKGVKRLSDLADIFDVSLDAMRYKAYRLRLIQEY